MRFSLPSIKCSAGPPSLRLLPNSVRCLNCAQRFDYRVLGSSRKLGGAGEHLIDDSEKHIFSWALNFRVRMVLRGAVILKERNVLRRWVTKFCENFSQKKKLHLLLLCDARSISHDMLLVTPIIIISMPIFATYRTYRVKVPEQLFCVHENCESVI